MPLVTENELLDFAQERGFAVPGFFPLNYEFIKVIIDVCEEEGAPVILCQGPEFIESFGDVVFTQAVKTAAQYAKIPVAMSVDHTFKTDEGTISVLTRDIALGWGSVMFDGSTLNYDDNLNLTTRMAKICKDAHVSCVGALGEVRRFFPQAMDFQGEFHDSFQVTKELMTDPIQAKEFVETTKVDTLAISVGQYIRSLWDGEKPPFKKTSRLDIQRIEAIRKNVDAHLILMGATHVYEEDLTAAAKAGVSMIKVASEQALIWSDEVRKFVAENPDVMFPEDIQAPALLAVKESLRRYIRLFNASNQIKKEG